MKKNRTALIPLILGLICIAISLFFFARVCRIKDKVYKNYKISLSDTAINEVFMNDNDEAAVREAFNNAVKKPDKSSVPAVISEDQAAEEAAEQARMRRMRRAKALSLI